MVYKYEDFSDEDTIPSFICFIFKQKEYDKMFYDIDDIIFANEIIYISDR